MAGSPQIGRAVQQLLERLSQHAPHLSRALRHWMQRQAGGKAPEDRFLQDLMYPIFDLPYWVGESLGPVDDAFGFELTYSTLNGYYLIRLVDDLVDRRKLSSAEDMEDMVLLSAVPFLHSEFHQAYARRFAAEHVFWEDYRAHWFGSFEAMFRDATTDEVDASFFATVSSRKLSAVNVPVSAVCHDAERSDAMPAWLGFCGEFGATHQAIDDLVDWYEDLRAGNTSGFLSRASESKNGGESLSEYVVREGFAAEVEMLHQRLEALQQEAGSLGSPSALLHLGRWEKAVKTRIEYNSRALQALRQVGKQFNCDP